MSCIKAQCESGKKKLAGIYLLSFQSIIGWLKEAFFPELKVTQYCVMCPSEEVSGDILLFQELLY